MTYVRGDAAQVDAWEDFGNPGWNWATLIPYYKKSEKYTAPSETQLAAGATYQSNNHGFGGHVHVGYTPALVNGPFAPPIIQTWESLSLPHNPDLNSGDVRGFSMGPQTLDAELGIRWDSARAYYYPVENRPNLKILKGTVKRITWAPTRKGGRSSSCGGNRLVANGVEVVNDDGETHVVGTRKEVVVSAGALRTPLVLESSGVGNPRLDINLCENICAESDFDVQLESSNPLG
jgi:choline dehydrogenase